jgi:hypothetical protein
VITVSFYQRLQSPKGKWYSQKVEEKTAGWVISVKEGNAGIRKRVPVNPNFLKSILEISCEKNLDRNILPHRVDTCVDFKFPLFEFIVKSKKEDKVKTFGKTTKGFGIESPEVHSSRKQTKAKTQKGLNHYLQSTPVDLVEF